MATAHPSYVRVGYRVTDGAAGGILGGTLMVLVSMLMCRMFDLGNYWRPINLTAATLHPAWGGYESFELLPSLLGIVIYLTLGVVLGGLISWLIAAGDTTLIRTLLVAMLVWLVFNFLFLPRANPALYEAFPPWAWAVAFFCYGLGLGIYLVLRTPRHVPRLMV